MNSVEKLYNKIKKIIKFCIESKYEIYANVVCYIKRVISRNIDLGLSVYSNECRRGVTS